MLRNREERPAVQTQKEARPRAARSIGAVIWDGALYLFAGFGFNGTAKANDVSDDLWRYRQGWQHVCAGGPPAVRYPSLVVAGDRFLRFGGCGYADGDLTFHNDIWSFDGKWSLLTTRGEAPAPRYTSAMAWHHGCLYVFAGCAREHGRGAYFGDLWRLAGDRWEQLHGLEQGPGRRYGFGWTSAGGKLFIFGGYDGTKDLDDLWALDLDSLRWQRLPSDPEARYCPALGHVDGRLVLFGGRSKVNPKKNLSDTWVFDGNWTQKYEPGPGYHAKPGYASDGAALWLYGGEGPRGHVSDLWRYDSKGWRLMSPARDDDPVLW
jgi:Galactose oxidase, central domain